MKVLKNLLILYLLLLISSSYAGYDYNNCYMGTCYDISEERESARRIEILEDRYERLIDPYHVSDSNLEDY